MNRRKTVLSLIIAAGLTSLAACGIGKPMDFPVPQTQLPSQPGVFTGDTGEWVLYRK